MPTTASSLDVAEPGPAPSSAGPPTRRELGWVGLGLALAVTLYLSPALFTGRWLSPADMLYDYLPWAVAQPAHWAGATNPVLSDSVLQFEPWLAYTAGRLHAGTLPLLNSENMLGAPFLANMQSAVFYPGNWPYFLWPDGAMLAARAWFKLFVAALGMYVLARQVLRVGPLAATLGTLTFTFGAFLTVWLLHAQTAVAVWLPWLWWATARLLARPGPRPVAVLAGIVALHLVAGHPETAFHLALATGLFALFWALQPRPRRLGPILAGLGLWAAAYLLGALVAAIQLVPFAEYLAQSAALARRTTSPAPDGWLPFHYAWTLINPDLFGNPARHAWWDLGTTLYDQPNYNETNTVALLAALGVEGFRAWLPRGRPLAGGLGGVVLVLLGVGVGGAVLLAADYFHLRAAVPAAVAIWNASLLRTTALILAGALLLAAAIALARRRPRASRALLVLLPLLLLADLWQAHADYNPTVAPQSYYPATQTTRFLQGQPGPFRLIEPGWMLMPNTNLAHDMDNLGGYDAVTPELYHELMVRLDPTQQAFTTGGYMPFASVQSPLLNLLNVLYLLVPPDTDPNYLLDVQQEQADKAPVGEIWGSRRVGQTFVAHDDNMSRIEVQGTTYGKHLTSRLILHLKTDPLATTDLLTKSLDLARLPDGSFWPFISPPLAHSAGQHFYFYVESPDARPGQAASFAYSAGDVYPQGTHWKDDQPAAGIGGFHVLARIDPRAIWFQRDLPGGPGALVFENLRALPRAWLVHRLEVQPDAQARVRRVSAFAFDAAGTAVLSTPLAPAQVLPPAPSPTSTAAVSSTLYVPEQVEIAAHSPAPGLLVLADQAFPGWSAQVDGVPAPILTMDHALRGLYLTAGAHTVRFTYAPLSFALGAGLSGVGLLLTGLLAWWLRRRRARTLDDG